MNNKVTIVLIALSISFAAGVVDYCNQGLCNDPNHPRHITCDATGDFAPSCKSPREVELTQEDIELLLNEHNQYRNKIAGGSQPGFNPAARMLSMTWDQDLADYASLNARRCISGKAGPHDCHNTPEVNYGGQNVFKSDTFGGGSVFTESKSFMTEAVEAWYSENARSSQNDIDNCCGNPKANIYHFLVMVNSKSTRIGCAYTQYIDNGNKRSYLVCNYTFANIGGLKVYESGRPASKCQTGNNPKFSALCSVDETIDVNDPFTY